MSRLIRPILVIALGTILFALPPETAAEVPAGYECNEYFPFDCDNALFIDPVCDIVCPVWIVAVCNESGLKCVD